MGARMSVGDALAEVSKDIEAMAADEFRAQHEAHTGGDIAIALRELQAFADPQQNNKIQEEVVAND